MVLMLQNEWDPYTLIITIFVLASCMCAPIGRALQERRLRRLHAQAQQGGFEQDLQNHRLRSGPQARSGLESPQDKNLQLWEETLLTSKDRAQKLDAIARLGKLGTKDTLDMLSEYAEVDRDPEILAAIEGALEQLEQRQIERRIKGEIEGTPEP